MKIRVLKWSGRLDSNQRPTVPKIVPERFMDSQELHKPCKLDNIPFMLFISNHQLHGHVLPLSYLLRKKCEGSATSHKNHSSL